MARDDGGEPVLGTVGWVQNNFRGMGASRAGECFNQESLQRLGRDDHGARRDWEPDRYGQISRGAIRMSHSK